MYLPMKGSHTIKKGNSLILMTSNMSIQGHCHHKWFNQPQNNHLYTNTFATRIHDIELKKPLFTNHAAFLARLCSIGVTNEPKTKFSLNDLQEHNLNKCKKGPL